MGKAFARNFDASDDVIEADGVVSEHVELGGMVLAREVHQPGWRWSEHVGPMVGTEWCETRHLGYVLAGSLRVLTRDGVEFDLGEGDVFDIPSGHDSWVIGDDAFEIITWLGARTWLAPLDSLRERVLATLVFTDIVDSTGTARRLGDRAWADLIVVHDQRLEDLVGRYRGQIVKLTGDGMLALFDGAARAIRCATACVNAVEDLGLSLRSAVHTGEIEVAGDEIHGLAVHEASRMLDLAHADEVIVSAITVDLAAEAGLRFEDRGEHQLKGVPGERRIFAAGDLPQSRRTAT